MAGPFSNRVGLGAPHSSVRNELDYSMSDYDTPIHRGPDGLRLKSLRHHQHEPDHRASSGTDHFRNQVSGTLVSWVILRIQVGDPSRP